MEVTIYCSGKNFNTIQQYKTALRGYAILNASKLDGISKTDFDETI